MYHLGVGRECTRTTWSFLAMGDCRVISVNGTKLHKYSLIHMDEYIEAIISYKAGKLNENMKWESRDLIM